jgi:hypothetical protein
MGTLIVAGNDLTPGLLNQYYGFADTTLTTVTATSTQHLSSVYTIPAGEPSVGSAYELWCGGSGQWGSTQQALTMGFYLNSTQVGVGVTIAAAAFAANANFRWTACMRVACASTGGGGTWLGSMEGIVTQTSNSLLPGTAADNTVPFADGDVSAITAATNANITAAIQAFWASATGSPTISNRWTIFRKVS